MAERLDLAYAINVHVAQGVTIEHGIVVMRSSERKLLTERSFLIALTRVADKLALVLDDGRKVERHVTRNTGDKTSALDVAKPVPEEHLLLDGPSGGKERSRDFGLAL